MDAKLKRWANTQITLELSLIMFPWHQPSVLLNYQAALCPWNYPYFISKQSIIVRHTHTYTHTHPLTLARILNTKYKFSLICWMGWNCFFLELKLLHYSHGRQMCVGLNGFIIHTVTQRLQGNGNILLSFSAAAIQPVLHPAIWHLLQC